MIEHDELLTETPISFGWKTTMANKLFFMIFSIVILALIILQFFLESIRIPFYPGINQNAVNFIFNYATAFYIYSTIHLGSLSIGLKFIEDKPVSLFSDLFVSIQTIVINFIATIFFTFIISVPIAIATAIAIYNTEALFLFLLAIIASFILALKYQFYPYVIVDLGVNPIQALKISSIITKNNKLEVFLLHLILVFVNIIGLLCFGIGLLFTIPISVLSCSYQYAQLRGVAIGKVDSYNEPLNAEGQV
ncbi:hypothetical protein QA601_14935 [Chitinispirillales bacterium ANBcel5]|uniref:hypothetical protein n=1 Tax=Cellulosispirillum alkaliphilum TaxID=3039283 RepID=UPI002A4E562C|nr:hypothetical protein [Chitinispirillales bacterium ANBcel5]